MNCHLNIDVHVEITKYISKRVKLNKRDGSWKVPKRRYKKDLGSFFFLVTRPGLILHVLLSSAKI